MAFYKLAKRFIVITVLLALSAVMLPAVMLSAYAAENEGKSGIDTYVYSGSGTAELPYMIDMDANGIDSISGETLSAICAQGQTWLFLKHGADGGTAFSWKLAGKYLTAGDADYPLGLELAYDGTALSVNFAFDGSFPGWATVTLAVGDYFPNGAIVSIAGEAVNTAAVVSEGNISFNINSGGAYQIKNSGKTVSDSQAEGATAKDDDAHDNAYTMSAYRGSGYGTELEPLTILGDLSKSFQASWKSMNTTAGFDGGSYPTEDSYDSGKVMKTMIEYRDSSSGRLNCSVYINGSSWQMTTESDKGPYYLDYRLNPDSETIKACLEGHSLYTGSYSKRLEPALKALTTYSESTTTQLFYVSRTREFAGPLVYRLNVLGYYSPGDVINVEYVLGAANGGLYHGTMPSNASLLLLEPSYSKYDSQAVVDYEGYVSFAIYNGGFFTLTKNGVIKPVTNLDVGYTGEAASEKTAAAPAASAEAGSGTAADAEESPAPSDTQGEETEISAEAQTVEEEIAPDTQSETGVLQEQGGEDDIEDNFSMTTEDGAVSVEGYISGSGLTLSAEDQSGKKTELQDLFTDIGELEEVYSISLKNSDGSEYELSGSEYLNVTIHLKGSYSIMDMDLLTVRHIDDGGAVTDEFFPADSELDENGETAITFKTTHLSSFAVILTESAEESPTAIAQEHTTEAASSLAQTSSPSQDKASPIIFVIIGTVIVLAAAVISVERKVKKQG